MRVYDYKRNVRIPCDVKIIFLLFDIFVNPIKPVPFEFFGGNERMGGV